MSLRQISSFGDSKLVFPARKKKVLRTLLRRVARPHTKGIYFAYNFSTLIINRYRPRTFQISKKILPPRFEPRKLITLITLPAALGLQI